MFVLLNMLSLLPDLTNQIKARTIKIQNNFAVDLTLFFGIPNKNKDVRAKCVQVCFIGGFMVRDILGWVNSLGKSSHMVET